VVLLLIDLTELLHFKRKEILIDEVFSFPDSYLIDSEIKGIGPVTIKGKCQFEDSNIIISGSLSGEFELLDSISLEKISSSFSFEFEEILSENMRNDEKFLDITDILWQNIVLEVPLKQTEVSDFGKYQGDGWKLISEEEAKVGNHPFGELANMWGEE